MSLLEQVIGSVLGQVMGGGSQQPSQQQGGGFGQAGGGAGSALSPILTSILIALIAKGASGGLGSILGGGREPQGGSEPQVFPQGGDGDLGGFGRPGRGGRTDDLSGMLDGPGGAPSNAGSGPSVSSGAQAGGLEDIVDSFQKGGLGDVIGSWIGKGQNQEVAPGRLEDVLGRNNIDSITNQTGMSRDDLLAQLAKALPQVIDALTPNGRLPDQDERRGW